MVMKFLQIFCGRWGTPRSEGLFKLIAPSFKSPEASILRASKVLLALSLLVLFSPQLGAQVSTLKYTFTNAGATGQFGPTQSQANTAYSSTNLAGKVTIVNGIQYWVVPQTGYYHIKATGANGYGPYGGRGAFMSGDFQFNKGDSLKILVGQQAPPPVGSNNQYAGGGGTFVTYTNNTPLIVAGGGGGSWATAYTSTTDASITTSGNASANAANTGAGGTNGDGGPTAGSADGGGGLLSDGGGTGGGASFLNGGAGGAGTSSGHGEGGFGGGGGTSSWDNYRCGGGGGYSGGAGAGQTGQTGNPEAGGGGSYNAGIRQSNQAGVGTGDGLLVIEVLSTGAQNDAGVVAIDSPNVYCAGVQNVVVSVQNFGLNIIDSVTLNWSVDGVPQTSYKYIGVIDTVGGTGASIKQVPIGSYSFTSAAQTVKVWSSAPNGMADTVLVNDTAEAVKQANLPPPTNVATTSLSSSSVTLGWTAGSLSNTWAYTNSTSNTAPTGPGTTVSTPSVTFSIQPRTTYYFYVREICPTGDSSVWLGPFVYRTPCAATLAGTYTIDPSQSPSTSNFVSFSNAALALQECGVTAPVNFQVAAGTYTERVELNEIPGASATNAVSFVGAGRGSTIITNDATGTGDMVTVLFNGVDYVTFRDMTISATDLTNGVGVMFTDHANYNSLRNIKVEMNKSSTGSNTAGVSFSGSITDADGTGDNGNYNILDSLDIEGAYYGISMRGASTGSPVVGNEITNCNMSQQYYYPIYTYYGDKLLINNCTTAATRNTAGDGFFIYYASNSQISNNRIDSRDYGMYLYYFNAYNYDNTIPSLVYNNMVHSSSDYGVYFYYADNIKFYHNSVSATSGYAVRFYNSDNAVVLNNHFKNYRAAAASYVFYSTGSSFDSLDYNNYMSYSTSDQFYFEGALADYDAFRADQPFFNEHSYNKEPNFTSNSDLHINQSLINMRGINVGVVETDNDGDVRCLFAPTLGADESLYPTPAPSAVIASPDSVFENSPAAFFSAYKALEGVALDYTWFLNGAAVDKGRDYKAVLAAGTYDLALKVRSCTGYDSVAQTIDVVAPTSIPYSDFTASKVIIDELERIQFTDLSSSGATSWTWSASPSIEVVWDNPSSDNPNAFFLSAGEYDVCLETKNANGTGTKKCKIAYISVNENIAFCSKKSSTSGSGLITDEGGATGVYTNSTTCSFGIQPCADQIFLKFSEFSMADGGDILKVYDGLDNTGTLLGTFTAGSGLPGGNSGLTANSGKMFLEWTTNGTGTSDGFVARWTSTPDKGTTAPVADFTMPDTIFTGSIARFESTSTGPLLTYNWDFDSPNNVSGFEGGNLNFDRYSWNSAGTYSVALSARNCGGIDLIIKSVVVIDPTTAPIVGFKADKLKAPVLNTITLTDTSRQGPTSWKWEVTPAFAANIIGPDNDKQLKVSFTQPGKYTVKLVVSNGVGDDSVARIDYIEIFNYCDPVAGALSADIGIGRVKLRSVDNITPIGQTRFTSYLNDFDPVEIFRRDMVEITLERNSIVDSMNRKVWIDWNNDGDFDEVSELVAAEPAAKTLSYTATFAVPSTASLGFTVLRVGTSYGSNNNTPCGINPTGEYEDYPLLVLVDDVKPVVTLNGPDTVWVEQWYQYTDAKATAMDNVDGNLTSLLTVTNNVDTTKVGTYYVTYTVNDADGNTSETVTRVVIVTPDVTAPVITVLGTSPEIVTVNTAYSDAGATATDYFNRNLTGINTGDNIMLNKLGTYYVYYTVTDAAGNKDSATRTVSVIDDIAPVISLNGGDTVVVEVNTPYTDPGFTVTDNYYSAVATVVNQSMVNFSKVGIYPVVYTATDSSGNATVVTRYINVQDNTLPVIALIGSDTVVIDVHHDYFEQGAAVTDNYCQGVQWTVDKTPNKDVLGDYVLTYSAVDCENNSAITKTRVVKVVDRIAPVLYLKGLPTLTVQRWQPYTDAGVKIVDNYYDSATLAGLLTITSDVDLVTEGVYSICYEVTDPSGNNSNQVCRVIVVAANTTSVTQTDFAAKINLYPNPSNGEFTIDFGDAVTEEATVNIVDMTGKTVYTTKVQALAKTKGINLTGLPAGVYMAHIEQSQHNAVLRFTIINQ
jgi:PKD repeat protein